MTTARVALIVQNCIAGDFKANIESSLDFISKALQENAQLIVFPEMNLTGYVSGEKIRSITRPIESSWTTLFSSIAKEKNVTILIGVAEQANENIFASQLSFLNDGTVKVYRKIHSAPFEKPYFSAGNNIPIFNSHSFNFGIQLCYDAHFPELALAQALKKVDVIFIPHASPRGTSKEKFESWKRHLRARAFDNGVYIAACNQVGDNNRGLKFPGISLFIGPDGNILYHSIDNNEGLHIVTLDKLVLSGVRNHKMKYFLPNRRQDLFKM